MGIYQDCYLEARADMHVNDIFVRPLPDDAAAEAWIEINNYDSVQQRTQLLISVFGQNFEQTVVRDLTYTPRSTYVPGVGDLAKPTDNQSIELEDGLWGQLCAGAARYERLPVVGARSSVALSDSGQRVGQHRSEARRCGGVSSGCGPLRWIP